LVIAEPLADEGPLSLEDLVATAATTLLVLPKWQPPLDDGTDPGPIVLGALSRATSLLMRLEVGLEVRRVASPVWPTEAVEVHGPTQLLHIPHGSRASIEALKACSDGVLFARTHFEGRDLYILSDPDIIANHSLSRGHNAAQAVQMVRSIVAPNAPVLFEETLHGLYLAPSLVRSLLRPPLAWATLQAALIILALVAIATVRFGQPLRGESGIPAGKRIFITNIAEIQGLKKSLRSSLQRYLDYSLSHVCTTLNVTTSDRNHRMKVLEALSSRYQLPDNPATLQQEVLAVDQKRRSKVKDILLARRIQQWRRDVIYAARRPK
jgi:hypothetical protein